MTNNAPECGKTELKPCPFCGGKARVTPYEISHKWNAAVSCVKCLAVLSITARGKDEAICAAIKAWNDRADRPTQETQRGGGDAHVNKMRDALVLAGKRFRFYEQQHRAKVPPDTMKIENNVEFAEMCEQAAALYHPEAVRGNDDLTLAYLTGFEKGKDSVKAEAVRTVTVVTVDEFQDFISECVEAANIRWETEDKILAAFADLAPNGLRIIREKSGE